MFSFLLHHSPLIYFTQPFWRDEAYSVLFAGQSVWKIVTAQTMESPVYYILLHFWIKIFGQSEIAVRSLSLLGFTLTGVLVIYLAEHLFEKQRASWFVPLLFFLNPFFLYYAFEARAYGWYMLSAITVFYAYLKKNWRLFTVASIFGIYTHLYMVFVPFVCFIHTLIYERKKLFSLKHSLHPILLSSFITGIAASPLLISTIQLSTKLKNSWYYPVDFQLITSVLGNMFIGYDGTPGYLWIPMKYFSIILFVFFYFASKQKKDRKNSVFFLLIIFIPLTVIIGISFLKPLFVNRYLLPVVFGEIFLIGYAISHIRSSILQTVCIGFFIIGSIFFDTWYPPLRLKQDYRTPMKEINNLMGPKDVIFADDPLILFETTYYAKNRASVYFYDPSGNAFPWYIGDAIVDTTHIVKNYPLYPNRAFVLHRDGTYTMEYTLPLQKK